MAHIPSCTTAQMELVTFDQALESANTPSADYDIQKWLYAPNFYSEYRYILGTRGKNPLICIGINPSTARPDALDNTLKSVERIALGNGFDSFIMFNVYAQRATDPDSMEKQCNPLLHRENLKAFSYVLSISEKPAVWAAWGAVIEKRRYLPQCLKDFLPQVKPSAPTGTAPVPSPKRVTPTIPSTCARMRSCGPLMWLLIWRICNFFPFQEEFPWIRHYATPAGIMIMMRSTMSTSA